MPNCLSIFECEYLGTQFKDTILAPFLYASVSYVAERSERTKQNANKMQILNGGVSALL